MKMRRAYRNLRKSEMELEGLSYLPSSFLHKATEVGILVLTFRHRDRM